MLQAFSQAEILIGSRFQQGLPAVQHTVKAQLAHELFMDRWIHRFYLFEVEGLLEILFATDVRMLWQTHWLTGGGLDRKSTRLNSSHVAISYAVFCLKKKKDRQAHV